VQRLRNAGEAASLDRNFRRDRLYKRLPELRKTSVEAICGLKDSFEEGDTPFPEKPRLLLESSEQSKSLWLLPRNGGDRHRETHLRASDRRRPSPIRQDL
jgi:hypothetical protein